MERLTVSSMPPRMDDNPLPVALWSGSRLRLDACSKLAARYSAGRLVVGRTARSLFPERDARAAIATIEAAMDTGSEAILRQRLWRWVEGDNLPHDIKVIATPVFKDHDSLRPVSVLTEATRACAQCLNECDGHEVSPGLVAASTMAANLEPGALGSLMMLNGQFSPVDAVALATIRLAARDAFVQAAGPLVEELRRRRDAPSGLETHLRYPQRRPS